MELGNEASPDPRAVISHSSFTERDFEGHHALTMYVGVHVLSARHRRHHHHHHRLRDNERVLRQEPSISKPSTPPSERVRFIIGNDDDESHSSHPIFSEMDELSWVGNKPEWMETARWIKFEEDVEEGGNRWSKPHIATVSLHSLLVLRSFLLNGSVLLDVGAENIEAIADLITDDMVSSEQLDSRQAEFVKAVLLSRHRHKEEQLYTLWKDTKMFFHPVKSLAEVALHSKARSQTDSHEGNGFSSGSAEQTLPSEEIKPLILTCISSTACSAGSKSFDCGSKHHISMQPGGSNQAIGDRRYSTGAIKDTSQQAEEKNEENRLINASFMKKIPPDAQASNILVGELPFLERAVTCFVRLQKACILSSVTEIPLPSKFIFVIFCPPHNIESFHEVGRAFATVMSDEVFHDVAYKARTRTDLLSGIDEFMDAATVLPASAWDPTIRIEPLPMIISQDGRRKTETKDPSETDRADDEDEAWKQSGLKRTGKPFGGLINDIRRKVPWYWSDFKDFVCVKSMTSVIFLYFACLAPIITFGGLLGDATGQRMAAMESLLSSHVCGVIYGLFSGQPLTILGTTGALLVFEGTIFSYCEWWNMDYLSFRLWIGLWTAAILFLFIAFDASVLVCYITRFTEEVFATLISIIFIVKAFQNVMNISVSYPMKSSAISPPSPPICRCLHASHNTDAPIFNVSYWTVSECIRHNGTVVPDTCSYSLHYVPNVYLLSLILFAGTFGIGLLVRRLKESPYFPIKVRYFMSDFAAAIGMITMTILDACLGLDTPKLSVPDEFKPTWQGRDWQIPLFGNNSWWTAVGAVLPALVATVLIFMDQQVTAVIVNRRENKLKKGCGYHLDLFVIAILIVICSMFGLPWGVAATMLSMTHVTSLEMVDENSAPGEKARFLGIREQRGTGICIFTLVGLSIFFTRFLQLIPMPVLYGIFLYMGVSSLKGLQFLNRIYIWFMPQKYQPDLIYLRQIPMKIVHCFTITQLSCLLLLFIIKYFAESALFFPAVLILVIVLRQKVLGRFFSESHLKVLDDNTPELIKQRNEEYQSADNLHQPHAASSFCQVDKSKPVKENNVKDSCIANISVSLMQSSLWKCIDQQAQKTPPLKRKFNSYSKKKKHHSEEEDAITEEQDSSPDVSSHEAGAHKAQSSIHCGDNPSFSITIEGNSSIRHATSV